MTTKSVSAQSNRRIAKRLWHDISPLALRILRDLTSSYRLSVASGELLLLDGRWYVTHTGLLTLARRNRCAGIHVRPVEAFCDLSAQRWAFEATVYKSRSCRGFVGFGDAHPSNITSLLLGAEMRIAETRAVNRALRKAYGIGICSVEELGSLAGAVDSSPELKKRPSEPVNGHSWVNGPRVRDRLCQIIRKHQLDAALVKAYATDFCGVKTLREATREQVENFVQQLADWAEKDRNALLCQLKSYMVTKNKPGAA